MSDDHARLTEAADTLGADYTVYTVRKIALHNVAVAMIGPARQPEAEVQVLLAGALVEACRHVGIDRLKAFDDAIAALQQARGNTAREIAEAAGATT